MNVTASAPADDKQADRMKKPISWLPVDGSITINEDYTAIPAKTAAVADANKSLESGDRKGAMEKLKLADMNVEIPWPLCHSIRRLMTCIRLPA